MKHLHTYILALLIAALLVCAFGCASAWRAVKTGGPTAAGAAGGALLGGPVGAAIGGATTAVISEQLGMNDELRDGDLIGEGAAKKYVYVDRPIDRPFIPTWVWYAAVAAFLWLKGHHIYEWIKGGGVDALLKLFALKRTVALPRVKSPTRRK